MDYKEFLITDWTQPLNRFIEKTKTLNVFRT